MSAEEKERTLSLFPSLRRSGRTDEGEETKERFDFLFLISSTRERKIFGNIQVRLRHKLFCRWFRLSTVEQKKHNTSVTRRREELTNLIEISPEFADDEWLVLRHRTSTHRS